MSGTLEGLERQIRSGQELHSIVRTMKTLAATSVRQYERATESLDDYLQTVELGLSVVFASSPGAPTEAPADETAPVLMLVFGSDHGLVGRFNEQMAHFAAEGFWQSQGADRGLRPADRWVCTIGEQVFHRWSVESDHQLGPLSVPTSIEAITPFVQRLLESIDRWRSTHDLERVMLFFHRPVSGGFAPRVETLLPVNLERLRRTRLEWNSRSLPTYHMPPDQLLSSLLRQYFFVSLYRACALSLAAENTSRLLAMQAAEKNIDERLSELHMAHRQQRQAVITGELLDIVSGFRAVRKSSSPRV